MGELHNFGSVLDHLKSGLPAKRLTIRNKTTIMMYKDRLYHNVLGVRAAYVPTNADLLAEDWILIYPKKCK